MTILPILAVAAFVLQATVAAAEDNLAPIDPQAVTAVAEENTPETVEPDSTEIRREGIVERGLSLLFDRIPSTNLEISPEQGIEVYRDQGEFTLHLGGRLLVDAVQYFEDKNALSDDNFAVRDARIELQGTFTKDLAYRFSGGIFS